MRSQSSCTLPADAKVSNWRATAPMAWSKKSSPGCMTRRFNSQGSRGSTQLMLSGGAPLASNHDTLSMAVLPAPSTLKLVWPGASRARSFGGTHATPPATLNLRV